jgi:hypothetical protein
MYVQYSTYLQRHARKPSWLYPHLHVGNFGRLFALSTAEEEKFEWSADICGPTYSIYSLM